MKSLKIFLFIIVGIIILVLLAATFAPNNVTITTSITIDAKPKQIYNNVVSLKNWKHWSPFEHDSTMTDKFSGPESGVGSTREWKGKAIGEGKMTVIEATEYTHIKNNLDFGTKGGATGTWTFNQADSTKTHVTWSTHITGLKFPFERLMGLILEPMMKPMFDDGLKDLKEYTETGKVDKKENKKLKNE
jgi:ribosome-associated toxin RatA of RatAB toxin-antitoxin module